jgi:rhamnogalacturonyl hydrolase YesR
MTTRSENLLSLEEITQSLDRVTAWVEKHDYKGYEPFDGLSTPFRFMTFGSIFLDRLLMQAVRQSPINLRPLLFISRKDSTKGRGYMAWGYLARYRTDGNPGHLRKAEACLDWLDAHKSRTYDKHSWSNAFDFASRGGRYTKNDPIIVWTAHIAHAYLDAYEITGNPRWLRIAESACGWVMDLPRNRTQTGNCLAYMMTSGSSGTIHNSNMLGGAVFARAAKLTGNAEFREVARSAMEFSCTRQSPDGSWWYGEEPRYHWIDNFHTGYNLDSLKYYIEVTGDNTWRPQLLKGLDFYKKHFFAQDGRPSYYHNRAYPIDSQCAGQAIETLSLFSDSDQECLELSRRVATWTIRHMQEKDGHFHYRHYPWGKAKTGMLHWSQAVIFKGLSLLVKAMNERS